MIKKATVFMDKNPKYEIVSIKELQAFEGHPFRVAYDKDLFDLMQSIQKEGVIVPLIVRKNGSDNSYEIISGHRRKAACEWAGMTEVPVLICDFNQNEAIIAMVDSNLQREKIYPSEKAFAYKMKLEAMKQEGKKNNSNMPLKNQKVFEKCVSPMETKTENPTFQLNKLTDFYDNTGKWKIEIQNKKEGKVRTDELLARQVGESRNQIARYIRLTHLMPKILTMVDEEKLAFRSAVEISYLTEEEQYELYAVMELEQTLPSISQANRMKRMSQAGKLTMDMIYEIMEELKPNQREKLQIPVEILEEYFPEDFTPKQKVALIEQLVKDWYLKQIHKQEGKDLL